MTQDVFYPQYWYLNEVSRLARDQGRMGRGVGAGAWRRRRRRAEQTEELLELASTAAHSSERAAAPLACWVAGRAGATIEEFHAAAGRVNQLL